ncbi:MAG: hypothetical protein Q8L47_03320 [bacterium]|nr:hypothetical protein [bacterium]
MWLWFDHKHYYNGPESIQYTPLTREYISEYFCKCGAKIRVFADGEVLAIWDKDDEVIYESPPFDGDKEVLRKSVKDFDVKKTRVIIDTDILN